MCPFDHGCITFAYIVVKYKRQAHNCFQAFFQGSAVAKVKAPTPGTAEPVRKTEAISVRIDPVTRYGLELLGRIQRRPIAGVVGWSIHQAFADTTIKNNAGEEVAFPLVMSTLWACGELERLLTIRLIYPSLLNSDEERLSRVLLETRCLWVNPNEDVRYFNGFRWSEVLPHWDALRPVLFQTLTGRAVVPLSEEELRRAKLTHLLTK